jgi:hypothetical protein
MQRMVIATKRARMARAMVTAMRVAVNKESEGGTGAAKRAMAMAARAMATRVAGEHWQQG